MSWHHCLAVRDDGIDFPSRCHLQKGHEGPHESRTNLSTIYFDDITWEDDDRPDAC